VGAGNLFEVSVFLRKTETSNGKSNQEQDVPQMESVAIHV
jgi:hypothetical protein